MIEIIRQMDSARRKISLYAERWHVIGCEIYNEEGDYMGRFNDAALAESVSEVHNVFLPVTNIVVMLLKKRVDSHQMKEEQDAE